MLKNDIDKISSFEIIRWYFSRLANYHDESGGNKFSNKPAEKKGLSA